ncbi:MAG: acetate--CoA ligase family protein, partial [Alphaproteobacteria bacterium]|nr:acetate--CoA ligase family protein [Alphaproteobacteria bacterium]
VGSEMCIRDRESLGQKGTKVALIITAGFGEMGEEGKKKEAELVEIAKKYGMRIAGPNCLGVMTPEVGLAAGFVICPPLKGNIAFAAQSGAILSSVVDLAMAKNIGFSHLLSLGNMADVDFDDVLEQFGNDDATDAIIMYMESVKETREFMKAAREAAKKKPVILIKSGKSDAAAEAAASHTGALAGSDAVYDAAFKRAGLIRVENLSEMFQIVEIIASGKKINNNKLTIVTNGGGIGLLATDALISDGGELTELNPETKAKLDEVLPETWSHANPIDIIGDAPGKRYEDSVREVLEDENDDSAVLVLNCPLAVCDSADGANGVVNAIKATNSDRVVLANWLGAGAAETSKKIFMDNKIPSFNTPAEATKGFMYLANYKKDQDFLNSPAVPVADAEYDYDAVKAIIDGAIAEGREWLSEYEAKNVAHAYSIPVARTINVANTEEAIEAGEDLGYPLVLKIFSHDITHKSDAGGVVLNIKTPEQLKTECEEMLVRVGKNCPDAKIEGFSVQNFVNLDHYHELIVGVNEDAQFGPVVLFGRGGTAVEIIKDTTLELPPMDMNIATSMINRTKVSELMNGYRDVPAARKDLVAKIMVNVCKLIEDFPEIIELDLNPIFANHEEAIALDARVLVKPFNGEDRSARFAINPKSTSKDTAGI